MNKLKQIINGKSNSTYIISEIGINHNGILDTALELIYKSKEAKGSGGPGGLLFNLP